MPTGTTALAHDWSKTTSNGTRMNGASRACRTHTDTPGDTTSTPPQNPASSRGYSLFEPAGHGGGLALGIILSILGSISSPSRVLAADPGAVAAGVHATPLAIAPGGQTGFSLISPGASGLTFTNSIDDWASAGNRVLNNGSGVAAGDFDKDGHVDLFFSSLSQGNRLFRNRGNWQFEDVTVAAGLRFPPLYFRAAVFADVNGDTWLDLLVGTASQGVLCFTNDQRGHFSDATLESNLASPFANETLALADIDGNGTLDLYVCNNRNSDIRDQPRIPIVFVNKKPTVLPEMRDRIKLENGALLESGEPDILYLNDGYGHFRSVSWTNGAFYDMRGDVLTNTPLDWGLCASFRDFNQDGAPDLYVCNDYWTPDRLWINGGRGRFKEVDGLALRKIPASSMGADFADINRDGHVDIFAVDMLSRSSELRRRQTVAKSPVPPRPGDFESRVQTPHNVLLLSRGDGTYAEIAWLAGVAASEWSWSPVFLDVDLDGYDDLLVTSGHLRDIQDFDANDRIRAQQEGWRRSPMASTNLAQAFLEARREHARFYPRLDTPIVAYRNRGDLRFEEATIPWGLDVPGVNHGIVTADFDNDGDLDIAVNRLGSPAALFRNNSPAPRIAVRLRGRPPNTQAIGAKIELLDAGVSNQVYEVTAGGSYMSGSDTLRVFAPGAATNTLRLRVTWRDGSRTQILGVKPNHAYEIDETTVTRTPKPAVPPGTPKAFPSPIFEDVSARIAHRHHDEPFDDLARQPLLPRTLDQGGPGITWFDLDADGWDDLIIGSGRNGAMRVFRNQAGKEFIRDTNFVFATAVPRDQTTILGWHPAKGPAGTGPAELLAGESNYESPDDTAATVPSARRIDLVTGTTEPALSPHPASTGPLALADYDGDGDLDLFAGSTVVPGRYPAPSASRLFRQTAGQWTLDAENTRTLERAGVVNGAVWSDINADGRPDLVLACEWGPIRIFIVENGRLAERTTELGLAGLTGLWQSVTAGDFDGDGRLDLIAGNWGVNSAWQATSERPLALYFGDLAGRDSMDILEVEFDPARGELVPRHLRDTLAAAIPWLPERFPTHAAWSRATAADVLRDHRDKVRMATATTLASTVFLNRPGRFEARPLPIEAQVAPAFGLGIADFDGDGRDDLVLAQNYFAFRVEDARLDAGRGLMLRGDGRGGFRAVSAAESGLVIHGEQRGLAVADFDQDGRPDLAVGQNSAETKLFRNAAGRAGLRVRLSGPPTNPRGIGAIVRLKFGNTWGPAREIHAGSGYWSQDSDCPVLATPEAPAAVAVLWPDGHRSETPLTGAPREVTVRR